jgi:hypothetical protein
VTEHNNKDLLRTDSWFFFSVIPGGYNGKKFFSFFPLYPPGIMEKKKKQGIPGFNPAVPFGSERGQTPADAGGALKTLRVLKHRNAMSGPPFGSVVKLGCCYGAPEELPVMRKHREIRSVLVQRRTGALVEVVKWDRCIKNLRV